MMLTRAISCFNNHLHLGIQQDSASKFSLQVTYKQDTIQSIFCKKSDEI